MYGGGRHLEQLAGDAPGAADDEDHDAHGGGFDDGDPKGACPTRPLETSQGRGCVLHRYVCWHALVNGLRSVLQS